jgi:SOS-response transcriptional repressor LexA
MPDQLSTIERRVYHYLLDFLGEHTYQPSIREIGKRFRIKSTKTVSDILNRSRTRGSFSATQRGPAASACSGIQPSGGCSPCRSTERSLPVSRC